MRYWAACFAALTVTLCCLVTPTAALAGKVSIRFDGRSSTSSLSYAAGPGETNQMTLDGNKRRVLITDAAGVAVGKGCRLPDPTDATRARCDPADTAYLNVGDADDTVVVTGRVEAAIAGGPGNDNAYGGRGPDTFISDSGLDGADSFAGGPGSDSFRYSDRTQGVHADLEGDADDGEPGEGDTIGADVENLDGSSGDDELLGNGAANFLFLGRGNDRAVGGEGNDTLQDESGTDRLAGGPGSDTLIDFDGNSLLDAGPGEDRVEIAEGRLLANDGETDDIGCLAGAPPLELDLMDMVRSDCPNPQRAGAAAVILLYPASGGEIILEPFISVTIGCPLDGPRTCRGMVRAMWRGRRIGRARFRVKAGSAPEVSIRLRKGARRAIRRRGHINVTLAVRTTDNAGAAVSRSGQLRVARTYFQLQP